MKHESPASIPPGQPDQESPSFADNAGALQGSATTEAAGEEALSQAQQFVPPASAADAADGPAASHGENADDPAASAADAADAPAASHDENADDPAASNVEAEAEAEEQSHEAPAADDDAIPETSLPVSTETLSPGDFSTSLQPVVMAAALRRRALCEQGVV